MFLFPVGILKHNNFALSLILVTMYMFSWFVNGVLSRKSMVWGHLFTHDLILCDFTLVLTQIKNQKEGKALAIDFLGLQC
jgi:hypothetical protein